MSIEIMNPGYSKFLNNPQDGTTSPLAIRASGPSTALDHPRNSFQSTDPAAHTHTEIEKEGVNFRRRLWLEGMKYSNTPAGHRNINSNDFGNSDTLPVQARDGQPYSTSHVSEKQSGFRGYVFMSPWNGRCEFITGMGGGSLKVSQSRAVGFHCAILTKSTV